MDLLRLLNGYATASLPRSAWNHEAHLRAGLAEVLAARSVTDDLRLADTMALAAMRRRIRTLNEAHGVANTADAGYHETLTWFYITEIGAFLDLLQVDAAHITRRELSELGELLDGSWLARTDAPLRRYRAAQLADPEARRTVVSPGRARAEDRSVGAAA